MTKKKTHNRRRRRKSIMCCDVKLIPHWIWLRGAASLCGPEVNIVLCYSVWRRASETRPAIKPLLAHISPGRVTAGWNRPGTEGKEMKEARGVCGTRGKGAMGGGRRGGRGEGGGSKRRERRLDESQDEEKVGKCGAGDKKTGSRGESCRDKERETQQVQK